MGFLKKVGKVFKKVVKSKIFKFAMIAAAVYFTAGIGMAASGSAFAAGLPGIETAAGLFGVDISAGMGAAASAASGVAGGFGAVDASMAVGGSGALSAAAPVAESIGAVGATGGTLGAEYGGAIASDTAASTGGSNFVQQGAQQLGKSAASNAAQKTLGGGAAPQAGKVALEDQGWFSDMSPGAKTAMLMSGLGGAAKAGLAAWGAKDKSDQESKQFEQTRQDIIRRGGVPDTTNTYRNPYKTPGIINNPAGA